MIVKKKLLLFLGSAALTALLYLFILFLLRSILHLNPYLSVAVAYICAMIVYFLTNRHIVFSKEYQHSGKLFRQIFSFTAAMLVNFSITLGLVWLMQQVTGEVYSGSVIAGIVTTLLSYLVFNRIFK